MTKPESNKVFRHLRTSKVLSAEATEGVQSYLANSGVQGTKDIALRQRATGRRGEQITGRPPFRHVFAKHSCEWFRDNGDLLQVMRWPFFQNMTDHDLRAIYEYLSALSCNPGPGIADVPYLQNACE